MSLVHWLVLAFIPLWLVLQRFLPTLLGRYGMAHPKRLLFLVVVLLAVPKWFLLVLPLYCLYFFRYEYKAAQAVADTPSSKIASAAQGYVEISARALRMQALTAPYSQRDCLWYCARKFRTNGWLGRMLNDRGRWKLLEERSSKERFLITDGKASCYVDPAGAQVSALDHHEWFEGEIFYQEALFLADKPVYVLGDFRTESAAESAATLRRRMGELIKQWKQNHAAFLARFDTDGDGTISLGEMEGVRQAALEALQLRGQPQGPVSTIGKPADGRSFVISHHSQHALVKAHKRHSYYYLLLGVASVLAWGLVQPRTAQRAYDEPTYPAAWPALQERITYTCPELVGTYAVQGAVSALGETVVPDHLDLADSVFYAVLQRPQFQAETLRPYWRNWDTLSVQPGRNLNLLQVVAERSEATMAAFAAQLLAEAPDIHARWQAMRAPATRRAQSWELVERKAGTINPAAMDAAGFENAIDDEYLGERRHAELDKSGAVLNCGQGYAVRSRQIDHPQHRWIYLALTRDVEGNLVGKEYYSIRLADGITGKPRFAEEVLRWTRWQKLADAQPAALLP